MIYRLGRQREGGVQIKIGIPRALLYYWYGPVWQVFLSELGLSPLVSAPTGKKLLDAGVRAAVDEACLPVKVFLGHTLALKPKCDVLLIPRLVSISRKDYICPKFMGLPEMTKQAVGEYPLMVWRSEKNCAWGSVKALPPALRQGYSHGKIKKGLRKAQHAFRAYHQLLQEGLLPAEAEKVLLGGGFLSREKKQRPIGLIGHPYCLYDSLINLDTIGLLQRYGFRVLTPELFTPQQIEVELQVLAKPLFWTLSQRIFGTFRLLYKQKVEGIIYLSAFACGPEALIGELVKKEAKVLGLPLLQLDLDEHSGEAGFVTRIEAFIDLLNRKRRLSCV
jgi:predicted nucleotide-binding protein (sugar kinase/HSP70/actin superfamily)